MRYLLDSNVLLSAYNLHYQPSFCSAFWSWVEEGHAAGILFSIDKVRHELMRPAPLKAWADAPARDGMFLSTTGTLGKWRELATWSEDRQPPFKPLAKAKFLQAEAADAWLIAYASYHGNFTIITNEVSAPNSLADIKLPDAAMQLGVPTMSLYAALGTLAHNNFLLRP